MPDDPFEPARRPHPAAGPPALPSAPPEAKLRVVVADDNPVVRAGLGVLLSGRADIQVVAEAADGREAYEKTLHHRPDVVLLDVRMPGVDGISALPHLVGIAPVLMLTYSRESEIVHEALRLGAGGTWCTGSSRRTSWSRRYGTRGTAAPTSRPRPPTPCWPTCATARPRTAPPARRPGRGPHDRPAAARPPPPPTGRSFGKPFATATFCGTVFCGRGSVSPLTGSSTG